MWIPKWQRDRNRGVDSPIPTQAVSNEEFVPKEKLKTIPVDKLSEIKTGYVDRGGMRDNAAHGWVRHDAKQR